MAFKNPPPPLAPDPAPTPQPQPICPSCKRHMAEIGWLVNTEANLVTFFHNHPLCMKVINCQFAKLQQRVELASDLSKLTLS